MSTMIQKKITLNKTHGDFLAACKKFGFTDQSSMVRAALDAFLKEIKRKQRRTKILQKAEELTVLYGEGKDLTAFTIIDGDDLYETD